VVLSEVPDPLLNRLRLKVDEECPKSSEACSPRFRSSTPRLAASAYMYRRAFWKIAIQKLFRERFVAFAAVLSAHLVALKLLLCEPLQALHSIVPECRN